MKQIVLKNEIINNPPKLDPENITRITRYSVVQSEWQKHKNYETVGFDVSVRSDNGYLDFVYEADSKEEADEALRYITCQIKNGEVQELKEHARTRHLWYIVNNECPF